MAKKFYVVWSGRTTGIFTDWATTLKSVDKYPNAKFKSFPTRELAEQAFGEHKPDIQSKPTAQCDVQIYCDGACEPNPGKAASGIAVYRDGNLAQLWYGIYHPNGTNNTAELNALHQSLLIAEKDIQLGKSVEVLSDSAYSIDCISKWAAGWEKKGWKKSSGEIMNLELIKIMYSLYNTIKSKMKLSHVRGHAGVEGNELADRMSILGIENQQEDLCLYDDKINIETLLSMRRG